MSEQNKPRSLASPYAMWVAAGKPDLEWTQLVERLAALEQGQEKLAGLVELLARRHDIRAEYVDEALTKRMTHTECADIVGELIQPLRSTADNAVAAAERLEKGFPVTLAALVAQLRQLGVLHYKTPDLELVLGPEPIQHDAEQQQQQQQDEDPDDGLYDASGLRPDPSVVGRV